VLKIVVRYNFIIL